MLCVFSCARICMYMMCPLVHVRVCVCVRVGHHLRSLLRMLPPRSLSRLKPSTLPRMLLTLLLSMLSGSPPVECGEDWALALPWLEEGQAAMGQEIRDLCGKWAASFGSEEDAGPVAAFCKRMTSSTTSPVTVDADA